MTTHQHIADIAAQVQTPCWIYDAAIIRRQIARLRQFDVIRFAQKACSNTHILNLMREQGVMVDSVSLGEVERALIAGYQPGAAGHAPIVLTADLLDRATIARRSDLQRYRPSKFQFPFQGSRPRMQKSAPSLQKEESPRIFLLNFYSEHRLDGR